MHDLLEDPGAHPRGIVPPPAGAQPEGSAEEENALEAELADLALLDELAHRAPLTGDAKLMIDRDGAPALPRRTDHGIAFRERKPERLFQEDMGALPERRDGEIGMAMIGNSDANDINRSGLQHCVVIAAATRLRQLLTRGPLGRFAMAIDADDARPIDRGERLRGHLAPGAEARESDPQVLCSRHGGSPHLLSGSLIKVVGRILWPAAIGA